ncbi:MAG TPA: lipid II flippase MurJ [Candidatus Acidoferrales bacterium]|nr:lipid II flippase MurJ [Candidatus Acidoferrales bacterium]
MFQRARAGLEAHPNASPLVRGGLTLVAGVLTGNILGFARVAIIAYLLGTHSHADSLAVAMGPLDTLNSVVLNSVVFAFVPMLTAVTAGERTALFQKLTRAVAWVLAGIAAAVILTAPWLMRALAPGLDPAYFGNAVTILRILALSTLAAGVAAVHCALLYTDRRFAPTAFYQATLNVFIIAGALSLWKFVGVYSFAIGYTVGAWAQLGVVWFASRSGLAPVAGARCEIHWREILSKPACFVVYAAGLGLNITFTRAYATHAGPGMAAALDYCMRGVGVPMALLVNPISNSLLPEIARLRSHFKLKEALRLIDKTLALAALAAVAGCGFALLFRKPAIALLFEHGEFKAESTRLVAAAFLALGPSFVGWSLIEITGRSLFAIDRPWPPVIAAMLPVLINVSLTLGLHSMRPDLIGLGASVGLMTGFLALFVMAHASRRRWLQEG